MEVPISEWNRNILIVDDMKSIHDDFNKILGQWSLDATSEDQKLEKIEEELFRLKEESTGLRPFFRKISGDFNKNILFSLESAFQGEEALRKALYAAEMGHPYSLMFVDVRMPPGWNGVQTIKEIWKHLPQTEVVIVTAYSDYPLEKLDRELGLTDHLLILKKPFDPIEVQQSALALTTKWSQARQIEKYILGVEKSLDQTQGSLSQARINLIQKAKMAALGEMAGSISHELNTPLTSMLIASESLQRMDFSGKNHDDDLKISIATIQSGVGHITKVVNGLRLFCGESEIDHFEIVSAKTVIESTISLCREKFAFHNIELKIELPEEDLRFRGHSSEMSQALVNILNNAFDAVVHLPHPWVKLTLNRIDDMLEISIVDNGVGISLDNQSYLFKPFFTTKVIGSGVGLGLSISKGLIEAQEGQLAFDKSSKYTRFVVRLPLAGE